MREGGRERERYFKKSMKREKEREQKKQKRETVISRYRCLKECLLTRTDRHARTASSMCGTKGFIYVLVLADELCNCISGLTSSGPSRRGEAAVCSFHALQEAWCSFCSFCLLAWQYGMSSSVWQHSRGKGLALKGCPWRR